MKQTINEVFQVLDGERDYQQQRWPDHVHPTESYLTYMRYYFRVAEELASTTDGETQALDPLRKFAELGIACMVQNGVAWRLNSASHTGKIPRNVIYEAVAEERDYQALQHPTREPNGTNPLEIAGELTLIRTFLDDADQAWTKQKGDVPALNAIRKMTAVAIRCMQRHGVIQRTATSPKQSAAIPTELATASDAFVPEVPVQTPSAKERRATTKTKKANDVNQSSEPQSSEPLNLAENQTSDLPDGASNLQ